MHGKHRLVSPGDRAMRWTMIGSVLVIITALYLFFRVWSFLYGSVKVESDLQRLLTLDSRGVQTPGDDVDAVIIVPATGPVSLNDATPSPDLISALKKTAAEHPNSKLQITIQADEKAPYERVMDTLNQLKGFPNVTVIIGTEEL